MKTTLKSAILGGVSALAIAAGAQANEFNIPSGDLTTALDAYMKQSGIALMYSSSAVRGVHSAGARGEATATVALSRILAGTGFGMRRDDSGAVAIVPAAATRSDAPTLQLAQAEPARASSSVETVVVTSSKIKGDIQTVPIAITALSQEQLTSRQIAGGPDLVKEVPNLTFSKTNFTGYSIEIRGIGTQAVSVTTDPAVAVAFNDIPFIRNHFFEQEFYDVGQVEVLRGPQGTLYGRNATAGVVNLVSAKPTDQLRSDGFRRCRQLQQPSPRSDAQRPDRGRQARSARGRRMDQARRLHLRYDNRQIDRRPRSVVGPRVGSLSSHRQI